MSDLQQQPDNAGAPLQPPQTTEQPLAYKPISGWAIAGCAAGGVFALLVAVCTAVALTQNAPLFFPMPMLVLAVLGVILSLIGQRHVANSDGTRAGALLATVGLWLSVVSGLAYVSYYYVTGLAVENQANAFLMEKTDDDTGFFPRLRDGADNPAQLNSAFLLTRPATARGNARPDDFQAMRDLFDRPREGKPGELTDFREQPLVRILFKESAKDAEITPLSVQDWVYEMKMYKVIRNYRIRTKEVELEYRIAAHGIEGEGGGRKWFVNLRDSAPVRQELTQFGLGVRALRIFGGMQLEHWSKDPADSPLKNFAEKDATAWDRLIPDIVQRKTSSTLMRQAFTGEDRLTFQVVGRPDEIGRWEQVDGKLRLYYNIRVTLPHEQGGLPSVNFDGFAVLEPVQAVNVEQFTQTSREPEWSLVRVIFTSVTPIAVPEKKPKF